MLVCKESLETEDSLGLKVMMDRRDLPALRSLSKETSVSQGCRGLQDQLEHKDTKEQRGFKVQVGQRDPKGMMGPLGITAILELKESVVQLDPLDPEGYLDPQVPTACLATWALPAPPPWTTASW